MQLLAIQFLNGPISSVCTIKSIIFSFAEQETYPFATVVVILQITLNMVMFVGGTVSWKRQFIRPTRKTSL